MAVSQKSGKFKTFGKSDRRGEDSEVWISVSLFAFTYFPGDDSDSAHNGADSCSDCGADNRDTRAYEGTGTSTAANDGCVFHYIYFHIFCHGNLLEIEMSFPL